MVFFTCNHCGESLKKAAVEKHYNNQRCRNGGVFVSCMDCQKDFREDYVGHTKCITEAEKYSGKDYVPKESKNSGQKKQETWLEIVRSILATKEYEVSPVVRGIFQKLQSYENVPRKKAKFENFVKNSMRVRHDQAAAVWTVLEKALDKLKAPKTTQTNGGAQTNGGGDETVQQNGNAENGTKAENTEDTSEQQDDEKPKKKRKKSKIQEAEEQSCSVAKVEENQEEPPKKKKKKKDKEALTENGNDSTTQEINRHNGEALEPQSAKKSKESLEECNVVDSQKGAKDQAVLNFEWDAFIFKILGKHNDEMSLEDLKAKVLKRYKKTHQVEEVPYKVVKTFNKKLKKSGLFVEGQVVRLNAK